MKLTLRVKFDEDSVSHGRQRRSHEKAHEPEVRYLTQTGILIPKYGLGLPQLA